MLLLCLGAHALPALMRADTLRPRGGDDRTAEGGRDRPFDAVTLLRAETPAKNPQTLQRPLSSLGPSDPLHDGQVCDL